MINLKDIERHLAKRIKHATVQASQGKNEDGEDIGKDSTPIVNVGQVTDLDYVQHAIYALYLIIEPIPYPLPKPGEHAYDHIQLLLKELVDDAVQRIRHLQYFRETYNVKDTLEDAMETLQAYFEQHPGSVALVDVQGVSGNSSLQDEDELNCVLAMDMNCAGWQGDFSSTVNCDAHFRTYAVGYYYIYNVLNCNVAAMRRGLILIYECEGMKWSFSQQITYVKIYRRLSEELMEAYPLHSRKMMAYNTPGWVNFVFSLSKNFMTESYQQSVKLGCRWDDEGNSAAPRRLNDLMLTLSPEDVLRRCKELYTIRMEHQRTFRL